MNLYHLTQEMARLEAKMDEWAEANNGDITDFPMLMEFGRLEGQMDDKILDMGTWHKNLCAEAEAIAAEVKALRERGTDKAKKAERIKDTIRNLVTPGEKLENARCAISWHPSEAVELFVRPEDLEREYQRVTVDVGANLKQLNAGIKAGKVPETVARIVKRNHVQIR